MARRRQRERADGWKPASPKPTEYPPGASASNPSESMALRPAPLAAFEMTLVAARINLGGTARPLAPMGKGSFCFQPECGSGYRRSARLSRKPFAGLVTVGPGRWLVAGGVSLRIPQVGGIANGAVDGDAPPAKQVLGPICLTLFDIHDEVVARGAAAPYVDAVVLQEASYVRPTPLSVTGDA